MFRKNELCCNMIYWKLGSRMVRGIARVTEVLTQQGCLLLAHPNESGVGQWVRVQAPHVFHYLIGK